MVLLSVRTKLWQLAWRAHLTTDVLGGFQSVTFRTWAWFLNPSVTALWFHWFCLL